MRSSFQALLHQAEVGQVADVMRAIAQLDINKRDRDGDSLLGAAIRGGSVAMVKALLEAGASVATDKRGHNPLHDAAAVGSVAVARVLLEAGADPAARSQSSLDMTPLEVAREQQSHHATEEREKLIAWLERVTAAPKPSKKNAAINQRKAVVVKLSASQAAEVAQLIAHEAGELVESERMAKRLPEPVRTIYLQRGTKAATETVKKQLWRLIPPRGAQPDAWERDYELRECEELDFVAWESLYWRFFDESWTWMIRALLDAGLDPNQRFGYGDLLEHAYRAEEPLEMIELLLDRGADVKSSNVMLEAVLGDAAALRLLLEHGGDPNTKHDRDTNSGTSALAYALSEWEPELRPNIIALIEAGADVNAVDARRKTPLAYAQATGDRALVKLLEKHGAKRR